MAISDETFDILVSHPGSGTYPAIHVCVKWWIRPEEFKNDDRIICLTADAIDTDEFETHVDELIDQLKKIKQRGRRKIEILNSKEIVATV